MFDNITMRIENFSLNEWNNFYKKNANQLIAKTIKSNKVSYDWYNMRVTYFPPKKEVWIQNSIHKLYNNLNSVNGLGNSNDFKISEVRQLITQLEDIFQRDSTEFKLLSIFEYGFNISTPIPPFEIINRYQKITNKSTNSFFTIANKKTKPIQRQADFSNWKFKVYDKGKQMNDTSIQKLLRLELVSVNIGQTRKIFRQSEEVTLNSLGNKLNWEILFNHFIDIYDKIYKIPYMTTEVEYEDLIKIHLAGNKLFLNDLKKSQSKASYIQFNKEVNNTYQILSISPDNIHQQIRKKIHEKFLELYNN